MRLPQAYQTVALVDEGTHFQPLQNNSRKRTIKPETPINTQLLNSVIKTTQLQTTTNKSHDNYVTS